MTQKGHRLRQKRIFAAPEVAARAAAAVAQGPQEQRSAAGEAAAQSGPTMGRPERPEGAPDESEVPMPLEAEGRWKIKRDKFGRRALSRGPPYTVPLHAALPLAPWRARRPSFSSHRSIVRFRDILLLLILNFPSPIPLGFSSLPLLLPRALLHGLLRDDISFCLHTN